MLDVLRDNEAFQTGTRSEHVQRVLGCRLALFRVLNGHIVARTGVGGKNVVILMGIGGAVVRPGRIVICAIEEFDPFRCNRGARPVPSTVRVRLPADHADDFLATPDEDISLGLLQLHPKSDIIGARQTPDIETDSARWEDVDDKKT